MDDLTPRSQYSDKEISEWEVNKGTTKRPSRWDATPLGNYTDQTPRRTKSRWDQTPVHTTSTIPTLSDQDIEAESKSAKSLTFLSSILPSVGYEVIDNPSYDFKKEDESFDPIDKKFLSINSNTLNDMPFKDKKDFQFFAKLLENDDEEEMSINELKERKVLKLLLKIKNGIPPIRRSATRLLIEKSLELGADVIFSNLLPLMIDNLNELERHFFVKLIDKLLRKLGHLIKPYVHKILIVVEPLLIEQNFLVRSEGKEIIANLSKSVGLTCMITALRPDLDHIDENVRTTTAKSLSIVAASLGVNVILPFIKAVCSSRKSWQARHTGIRIIQQLAIIMGCSILPHLNELVNCITDGFSDEQIKVRTMAGLCVAALAEASMPFGFDSFKPIVPKLLEAMRQHKGKALAAFLKAFGNLIAIMPKDLASKYSQYVLTHCSKEFSSTDEDIKRIILKVVKQCTDFGEVNLVFLNTEIKNDFFKCFWTKISSYDKKNTRHLVDATVSIALKTDTSEIVTRLCHFLKENNEMLRRTAADCVCLIIGKIKTTLPEELDAILIDSIVIAFQEQTEDYPEILNCFSMMAKSMGNRFRPFITKVCSIILWRLTNKSARIRMISIDLISKISESLGLCEDFPTLSKFSLILYENLGEEFPEVLGSILNSIKSIIAVVGVSRINPSVKDILPRLTPILRNRHEKVQENVIKLIGSLADTSSESISAREWMRICFELVDVLKANRRSIRKAAIFTFGSISKIVGPLEVTNLLLNNLKVQDRQNRICTTIAIAIVAECCGPFTVLPSLMNEYRVPELNVQNGVLKSINFLFEYIAEMGKDYIYSITPLLEDALMERDLVHRQTAGSIIRHLATDVYGYGCDDALLHLLNFCLPNLFEKSMHLFEVVLLSIESLRVSLGSSILFSYLLQGLQHPARKVREVYWKLYNILYIGSPMGIVASYPRLTGETLLKSTFDVSF